MRRTTQSQTSKVEVELEVERGPGALSVRVQVEVEETRWDGACADTDGIGWTEDGEQVALTRSEQQDAIDKAVEEVIG